MTEDEAKQITQALFRMYPNSGAGRETMEGYFEFFVRQHNAAIAIQAINDVVLVETRLPSIAAISESYKARVRMKLAAQPALDPGEMLEDGRSLPQTPEQWEDLGRTHRSIRAQRFGDTPDPSTDLPLPRSHREFDKEWVDFLDLRYSGKADMLKGMEP